MKTLVRGAAALTLVMFVVSCNGLLKKLKGEEDADAGPAEASVAAEAPPEAGPEPTPAPTAAPAAAIATNEGDVARFPDETKLPDVAAVLLRPYNVREAPPAGELIVGLPKGTTVTQIAQRGTAFLVVFDDPRAPGTKLMGWVQRDAFSAVIQDAGPLVCPKGEIALFGDVPFCGKLCSDDAMCPPGQACKGQASKLLANGKAGDGVTVCTIYHPHDAGAPTPTVVDAGAPTVLDAGKVSDAGLKVLPFILDAGRLPLPLPPTGADVVAPTGGSCPAGFLLVSKTGKCHRGCPGGITALQCNPKSFCIKCDKDNKKVCATGRDDCK